MSDLLSFIGIIIVAALWLWSIWYVCYNKNLTRGGRFGYLALLFIFPMASIFPVWLLVVMGVGFISGMDRIHTNDFHHHPGQ